MSQAKIARVGLLALLIRAALLSRLWYKQLSFRDPRSMVVEANLSVTRVTTRRVFGGTLQCVLVAGPCLSVFIAVQNAHLAAIKAWFVD